MPFYTFKCTQESCQYVSDYLVKMDTKQVDCKQCGEPANYQMSYKFASTGLPNGHITNRGRTRN